MVHVMLFQKQGQRIRRKTTITRAELLRSRSVERRRLVINIKIEPLYMLKKINYFTQCLLTYLDQYKIF